MQGSIQYQLRNGKLISLPVPAYSVGYAVLEDDSKVTALFAMKLPGRFTIGEVMNRARADAPGIPWAVYACAETGFTNGSPNAYEEYTLRKDNGRLIIDARQCGDMATAFRSLSGSDAGGGKAVDDIVALLRDFGLAPSYDPDVLTPLDRTEDEEA
jgi:hypothetical protein